MNRTFTMLGLLALLVAGCGGNGDNGGDGGGGSGGGMDLSASASDMSGTLPADMQPAYGCHALAACRAACSPTDQTCGSNCSASSTMQARTLYQAVQRCVRRECYPVPDGGPAPCTFGGTPSAACTTCLADTIKATGSCGADTTYCGTCYMAYSACESDLP